MKLLTMGLCGAIAFTALFSASRRLRRKELKRCKEKHFNSPHERRSFEDSNAASESDATLSFHRNYFTSPVSDASEPEICNSGKDGNYVSRRNVSSSKSSYTVNDNTSKLENTSVNGQGYNAGFEEDDLDNGWDVVEQFLGQKWEFPVNGEATPDFYDAEDGSWSEMEGVAGVPSASSEILKETWDVLSDLIGYQELDPSLCSHSSSSGVSHISDTVSNAAPLSSEEFDYMYGIDKESFGFECSEVESEDDCGGLDFEGSLAEGSDMESDTASEDWSMDEFQMRELRNIILAGEFVTHGPVFCENEDGVPHIYPVNKFGMDVGRDPLEEESAFESYDSLGKDDQLNLQEMIDFMEEMVSKK